MTKIGENEHTLLTPNFPLYAEMARKRDQNHQKEGLKFTHFDPIFIPYMHFDPKNTTKIMQKRDPF